MWQNSFGSGSENPGLKSKQPKPVSISVIPLMCVQTGFRRIHKVKVSKHTDGKGACKTRHFLPS